ncbi:MAG: ribosome small subunit-dependent GTPase A [Paludibacteraceae bacterium]|nr:ribosome small subunit-dependent GTPase A [Paludibacteraceae bacterium]
MQGLVIKSAGFTFTVRTDDGQVHDTCRIKGNFRIRGIRTTSPVAIGDIVSIEPQADGTAWITGVQQRRNYIIRRASNLSKESQIMAANIDLAALVVTINHPKTLFTFVDRFLCTAEAYRIPACLIFNKTDLYNQEDLSELKYKEQLYHSLGYDCYRTVALQPDSTRTLAAVFKNKTVLLAGNSGVGKSTLLNQLSGQSVARTANLSTAHDKGMHTTTFTEMYQLPDGGWIIDSPGVRGFGMVDMKSEEIDHYFREIFQHAKKCRFSNCLHLNEPGCAVLKAAEEGLIDPCRMESYYSMMEECEQGKYR